MTQEEGDGEKMTKCDIGGKWRCKKNYFASDVLAAWPLTRSLDRLTHFQPMFHFYTSWKRQKTEGFMIFSGGIEVKHCLKMS